MMAFTMGSPLKRELYAALQAVVGQGYREVTQEGLADMIGRKVTASFRARMAELESEGYVNRYMYQTANKGYKVAYQINVVEDFSPREG